MAALWIHLFLQSINLYCLTLRGIIHVTWMVTLSQPQPHGRLHRGGDLCDTPAHYLYCDTQHYSQDVETSQKTRAANNYVNSTDASDVNEASALIARKHIHAKTLFSTSHCFIATLSMDIRSGD